jgi:hypothetical protein
MYNGTLFRFDKNTQRNSVPLYIKKSRFDDLSKRLFLIVEKGEILRGIENQNNLN